jgi:uncharacterized SAM-binding protein YcdF (DUF218 family)
MFLLKKLFSALILPPAGPLLLAAAGISLAAIGKSRRWRHGGLWLAAGAIGALFALSLPVVSHELMAPLQRMPAATPETMAQPQAIVVLGGISPHALERLRYAAHLARQTGLPLLVTGGAPQGGRPEAERMAEILRDDFATPVRWIENKSRDTAENAAYSAPLLKAAGIRRIALVSHAWHLPRAVPLFERTGFAVFPAPTAFDTLPPSLWACWRPSSHALDNSTLALNEYLGRLFNQLSPKTP